MDVKFGANKIVPYSEKQWNEYKKAMMSIIPEKAASCDAIADDQDFKAYIVKYAADKINSPTNAPGVSYKLANMEVSSSSGSAAYPILNEYQGHYVMRSYYFSKRDGQYVVDVIEVVPTAIIIPGKSSVNVKTVESVPATVSQETSESQ